MKPMTHPNEPRPSDLDIYINSLVEMLRVKYGYADKNRLKNCIRLYTNQLTYGELMMKGAKMSELESRVIEIPYTTLYECMANKTIPNQIKEIL